MTQGMLAFNLDETLPPPPPRRLKWRPLSLDLSVILSVMRRQTELWPLTRPTQRHKWDTARKRMWHAAYKRRFRLHRGLEISTLLMMRSKAAWQTLFLELIGREAGGWWSCPRSWPLVLLRRRAFLYRLSSTKLSALTIIQYADVSPTLDLGQRVVAKT